MEWWIYVILAVVAVTAIVVMVFVLVPPSGSRAQGKQPGGLWRSIVGSRGQSRLTAAEMLTRVKALRKANAPWDVIWAELNPGNDPEVQRLLIEIRGPHMFAPHLGLGVIEDGCKRVLASSPGADAVAALREATRRADPFVR